MTGARDANLHAAGADALDDFLAGISRARGSMCQLLAAQHFLSVTEPQHGHAMVPQEVHVTDLALVVGAAILLTLMLVHSYAR